MSWLEELVLCRLLPSARRPPAAAQIARDLAPLLRSAPSTEEVHACLERLRGAGELDKSEITAQGRARALAFLGLERWPERWSWKNVKAQALPARALGLSPTEPSTGRLLKDEDRLAAAALRRAHGLPDEVRTVRAALEALACRELGHPELTSLEELLSEVISRKLGASQPLSLEQLRGIAPQVLLDSPRGVGALRDHLVRSSLQDTREAPVPETLERFAQRVREAARASTEGRFGSNKVFVHAVWKAMGGEGTLEAFKTRLLQANRKRLLTLSRADLVQLMDPADVSAAEIRDGIASFHFVLDEGQP